MNARDIAALRLVNQKIAGSGMKTVKQLVHWMGAIQAQDYAMSRWAVGLRIPGCTNKKVESALHRGQIIRTHVLRPTWHLVAAADLRWMLSLSAPRIIGHMKSRLKELELSEPLFRKSNRLIEKVLSEEVSMDREALTSVLGKSGIPLDKNRSSHLLLRAELEGIICSGEIKNKRLTYALLDKRIPPSKNLDREEALAMLSERYFKSHGPATLPDFTWWSGLAPGDAKEALSLIRDKLHEEKIGENTYWYFSLPASIKKAEKSLFLLPAYDEFIISYKDRSAALNIRDQGRSISQNGIFKAVIVSQGEVSGLWKRSFVKDCVRVETEFFRGHVAAEKKAIRQAAAAYATFLGMQCEITL